MASQKSNTKVSVAVIGGSGLYKIEGMAVVKTVCPATPFGRPSDAITIGRLNGVLCAFLPRHGKGHRLNPSEIPHRANIFALKSLGVEHVVAISACGSLKEGLAPREFVVPDQIIDRTKGRPATFFEKGVVAHVSFARPFSAALSEMLVRSVRRAGLTVHEGGTYLCMEGPAFSTKAEARLHQEFKADVIGMTAIPEAKLAREAEMSYVLLCMVTDYDCWKESDEVSGDVVLGHLMANAANAKKIIADLLPRLKTLPNDCRDALKNAIFTDPAVIPAPLKRKLKLLMGKYVR